MSNGLFKHRKEHSGANLLKKYKNFSNNKGPQRT